MNTAAKRRWYQFSLHSLLVLTAMVACFFAGWKTREIAGVAPEPLRISGNVIAVEENLYRLSVGSDDGVSVGTLFTVSRGETKLGEIVVTKTLLDSCIGKLREPTWVETFFATSASVVIRNGDKVEANLPADQTPEQAHKRLRTMMNP